MATIRFILGFLCFAGFIGSGQPNRHLLNTDGSVKKILALAATQLDVREKGGQNRGVAVAQYLNYVGVKQPAPWCAAFISWIYGRAGYAAPSTAWSPALFPLNKRVKEGKPADVFGIYIKSKGRIAHCGLVESRHGDWIVGIEGNTNIEGGIEGDGVYRKWRHVKTIAAFAHWLPKEGGKNE